MEARRMPWSLGYVLSLVGTRWAEHLRAQTPRRIIAWLRNNGLGGTRRQQLSTNTQSASSDRKSTNLTRSFDRNRLSPHTNT